MARAADVRAEAMMRIALEEARRGLGRTSPNPVVGAVIAKGGRVISRGYHRRAGLPHAEVEALAAAGARAKGADLFSTLEPCGHFGRTPPCSEAIVAAGIARVYFASRDPNPLVNGRGVRRLRQAGVQVVGDLLCAEADLLNRPFFTLIEKKRPFVTLKAALSLDGKIAATDGSARWITGEHARERVHRLRDQVDAILVGANTIERDDPWLTTRLPEGGGRNPCRLVVDSTLRVSSGRRIFAKGAGDRVIVATGRKASSSAKAARLLGAGVEVWGLPLQRRKVAIPALLRRLAAEGLSHVLVEGGAELYGAVLRERLVDELWLFVAPKLLGGGGLGWTQTLRVRSMADAPALNILSVEQVGTDLLVKAALRPLVRARSADVRRTPERARQ